jgi:DNA repair protein RadD
MTAPCRLEPGWLSGGATPGQRQFELRPYQRAAIEALYTYWRGGGGNPLAEMATGTGKSLVIGELVRRLMSSGTRRVLILTHVRELIAQDAAALRTVWPEAPIGLCSAGLGERNVQAPIVIAGIQSVFRDPEALGPRNLVVIDEAHLVPTTGDGMYLTTIAALRGLYPEMRVCGLTATPYRLDSGRLDEGDNRLFDRVVFSYGIGEAVADGWLAPLVAKATASEIDVHGVARRGGEFVAGALEAAADLEDLVSAAADEIVERGQARRSWLVFCTGVTHAEHVRDALRDRGVDAETVTGDTPSRERENIFAEFRAGAIRALTGANVFTTGFDAPAVDLIAMLRPTLSTGLYVQMLGRGTRKTEDKVNCEVLDFAGNVRRHGPVDDVTVRNRPGSGNEDERSNPVTADSARAKACPACGTYTATAALTCAECGYQWERPRETKHEARAADLAVLSRDRTWKRIDYWSPRRHEKVDSPPSLRIDYHSGASVFSEWLTLEHDGVAREIASRKWLHLGGEAPAPATVNEAFSRLSELSGAVEIAVQHDGRYWRVVARHVRQAVPA